jgi:hypothetical protein
MQIETIIEYANNTQPPNLFELREYSTQCGDYYTEAVVYTTLISDTIGIVLEQDTFSPLLSYKQSEVNKQLLRLNNKALRSMNLIAEANKLFNYKYVRTKGDSGHRNARRNN